MFDNDYTNLLKQAKANRVRFNSAVNDAERQTKDGKLTPFGAAQARKQATEAYQAERQRLRQAYVDLVAAERAHLLRGLQQPPATVASSDWRQIARDVDQATAGKGEPLSTLIDRAQTFADQGLARGIAARAYREFVQRGQPIDHLAGLVEVDPRGVGEAVSFEQAHGALQAREARIFGPFAGCD
jgi:hypothetical protein